MSLMDDTHPFDDMVRQGESDIRLAHAALLWAQDEFPDLAPSNYLDRLSALADRIDANNPASGHDRIGAMRRVLVEEEAFRGNIEDFTNPNNSYLNCVVDSRRGIPVSLSAVWIDVADQLGWPLSGVSMPGHFILRYDGIGEELLIDPFNSGRELSREMCEKMFKAMHGPDATLADEHLAPATPFSILGRMLGNLYAHYVDEKDWFRTESILTRLRALRPLDALVHAELGRVRIHSGDLRGAAASLSRATELANGDEELSTIRHHQFELRTRLSERN